MGRFFGLHSAIHHNHFPQSDLVVPDSNPSTLEAEARRSKITFKLLAVKGKTQTGMWCRPVFSASTREAEAGISGV